MNKDASGFSDLEIAEISSSEEYEPLQKRKKKFRKEYDFDDQFDLLNKVDKPSEISSPSENIGAQIMNKTVQRVTLSESEMNNQTETTGTMHKLLLNIDVKLNVLISRVTTLERTMIDNVAKTFKNPIDSKTVKDEPHNQLDLFI